MTISTASLTFYSEQKNDLKRKTVNYWGHRDRLQVYYTVTKYLELFASENHLVTQSEIIMRCNMNNAKELRGVMSDLVGYRLVEFVKRERVPPNVKIGRSKIHSPAYFRIRESVVGWFFATEKGMKFTRIYEEMMVMLPEALYVNIYR